MYRITGGSSDWSAYMHDNINVLLLYVFSDHTRETTWLHPLTGEPIQTGYSMLQGKDQLNKH